MRLKTWLRLSVVGILPAFFSVMMIAVIAMEWYLTGESKLAGLFLNGKFAVKFTMIFFSLGVLSLWFMMIAFGSTIRHADKIEDLDKAIYEANLAKRKYEAATRKIAEQIKPE